ncbi:MAG TPA: dihydrofolate reductase family protein [Gammaproteobacteria bacterium]|nr:dihydrofolate reductase family protein [Gammaproteobacteria bacterium]
MRRLIVFNNISLDGYFTGAGGDFSWAKEGADDPEFGAFVSGNASGEGELIFGRVTYEMMASFWPTPAAKAAMPEVAAGMNRSRKVVFSRHLAKADWQNTRLMKGELVTEVRKLKQESGPGMAILGSGSIVAQLASVGLIDEYQFVVNPVVLGVGRTLFEGLAKPLPMRLTESRAFKNGKLFVRYVPVS